MKNPPVIFNLLACIPKNEWDYFEGWVKLNLAPYSFRHTEWFLILWKVWTKEINRILKAQNLPEHKVPEAHNRISPNILMIKEIQKKYMKDLEAGHESNIRSDLGELIREYIGLQKLRQNKQLVEKEALFFLLRSPLPETYNFYRSRFLQKLLKDPVKNSGWFRIIKHLLEIDTEFITRHPKRKSILHTLDVGYNTISDAAWITEIAEKSLSSLLNEDLSNLQTIAFQKLVTVADAHAVEKTSSESVDIPSSTPVLVFLYKWIITQERSTIEDLMEGLAILHKTCPFLEKDLMTNCIYSFHNIISFKLGTLSSKNHPDLKQLLKLQSIPYELALKHGSLAHFLIDFLNLMRIYMRNIDRLIEEKREVYEIFSLRDEPEIQELVSSAESTIAKYVPNVPEELRPSVISQLRLVISFYRENQPKFEKHRAEYTTKYHGLSPLFNLNSEWHILKQSFNELGKNVNDTIDSEYLSQQVRAFSAKCKRLKKANKNYEVYIDQLSAAADSLGGYLRAKRKQKRLEWLERIKENPTLLDKNWLIWKIEEYENENPR